MIKQRLSMSKCESCRKGYNGRPVLGWKPKKFQYGGSDPYKKFNIALLLILSICMIGLGMTFGMMMSW